MVGQPAGKRIGPGGLLEHLARQLGLMLEEVVDQSADRHLLPIAFRPQIFRRFAQPVEPQAGADREIGAADLDELATRLPGKTHDIGRRDEKIEADDARRQSIGDAARDEARGTRRERIRPARRQDLGELLPERRDAGAELGDTRAQIKRQA